MIGLVVLSTLGFVLKTTLKKIRALSHSVRNYDKDSACFAPSSSGLGHQVFNLGIMGSNPIGVTNTVSNMVV